MKDVHRLVPTVGNAGGSSVLEAKDIMCALIDADQLADLDDTERLQKMLTRAEG